MGQVTSSRVVAKCARIAVGTSLTRTAHRFAGSRLAGTSRVVRCNAWGVVRCNWEGTAGTSLDTASGIKAALVSRGAVNGGTQVNARRCTSSCGPLVGRAGLAGRLGGGQRATCAELASRAEVTVGSSPTRGADGSCRTEQETGTQEDGVSGR